MFAKQNYISTFTVFTKLCYFVVPTSEYLVQHNSELTRTPPSRILAIMLLVLLKLSTVAVIAETLENEWTTASLLAEISTVQNLSTMQMSGVPTTHRWFVISRTKC